MCMFGRDIVNVYFKREILCFGSLHNEIETTSEYSMFFDLRLKLCYGSGDVNILNSELFNVIIENT